MEMCIPAGSGTGGRWQLCLWCLLLGLGLVVALGMLGGGRRARSATRRPKMGKGRTKVCYL